MSVRATCMIAIAWALTPVTAAMAQETGTLRTHRAAQIDGRGPNAARIAMEQFGSCLVSRSRARVSKFVDMPVDGGEYTKYLRVLFDSVGDECLSGGELQFNEGVLRGALFQALYKSEFGRTGPTAFAPGASSGYRTLYGSELSSAARSSIALVNFGECVGRADAANVRALMLAMAGSSQENGHFNALAPRFNACVPKGETIAFSKVMLKGALAEGLYRLSKSSTVK